MKIEKLILVLLLIYIALALFYIFYNPITPEEGDYLYGSILTFSGKVPVFDFQSDLNILWYYFYGLIQYLFGGSIYLGRFTSFVISLLTLYLVFTTTKKLADILAATLAISLIVLNPVVVCLLNSINTYSLNSLLLIMAIYILISDLRFFLKYLLVIFFLGLASLVELTDSYLLILLFIGIIYFYKKNRILRASIIIALVAVICLYIYVLKNLDRWGVLVTAGIFPRVLHYNILGTTETKLEFLSLTSRFFASYILFFFTLLPVFFSWLKEKVVCTNSNHKIAFLLLSGGSVLIFIAHFLQNPPNVYYNMILCPFMSVSIGLGFFYLSEFKLKSKETKKELYCLALIIILFTSFLQKDYFPLVGMNVNKTALVEIAEVVNKIKAHTSKEEKIISFNSAVAVEAKRRLFDNTICGWKSFYPRFSDEQAIHYHVINEKQLVQLIVEKKPAAIFIVDPRYFQVSLACTKDIDRALINNYLPVKKFQDFNYQGKAYLAVPERNQ